MAFDKTRNFASTILDGPVGTLLGAVVGGAGGAFLDTMTGQNGVFTAALGTAGGQAVQDVGKQIRLQTPQDQISQINQHLQHAFREACLQGLADIAGPDVVPIQPAPQVPNHIRFSADQLGQELAAWARRLLTQLYTAIATGEILPLTPDSEARDVYSYVENTTLEMTSVTNSGSDLTLQHLADQFFDQTIAPWLTQQSPTLLRELSPLEAHLRRYLLPRTLVHFNQALQTAEHTEAWRDYNRLVLEEMRARLRMIDKTKDAVIDGQRQLIQRLDALLSHTHVDALDRFATSMADIIAASGRVELRDDQSLVRLMQQLVTQDAHLQDLLDTTNQLLDQSNTLINTTARTDKKADAILDELRAVQPNLERVGWVIPTAFQGEEYCPYPGLVVFDADRAPLFYGREDDIKAFLSRDAAQITAVTGPSGIGKSSFVLAGVVPKLKQRYGADTIVLTYRVSTSVDPLHDLAAFLSRHTKTDSDLIQQALMNEDAALLQTLAELRPNGTEQVIVVFDQFEELFVGDDTVRARDRRRLLDNLLYLDAQPVSFATIILTSRENYFEHPDYQARERLSRIVQAENVRLSGLTDLQLRRAIEQPLEAFNTRHTMQLRFEAGVVDLILSEFRKTKRTLPLVQYLLRLLWTEQHELSNAAYNRLGGLERVLDRHANTIYAHFDEAEQRLVHAVLLALVRPGLGDEYTRRRVRLDDLLSKPQFREPMKIVIKRLADFRSLLISEQQIGNTVFLELTHEVLLRQWERLRLLIELHKARLQTRELLLPAAEQWAASQARSGGQGNASYLYRGEALRRAREYTQAQEFQEEIDSGIQACYAASVRRQRRDWAILTAIALVTIVAIYAGVSWSQRRLADEQRISNQRATAQAQSQQTAQAEAIQRSTAEANAALERERAERRADETNALRLATLARQELNAGNRPLAVTLALSANAIPDPPFQAQQALAEVAYAPGFTRKLSPSNVRSPDGTYETQVGDDGNVILRNLTTQQDRVLATVELDKDAPVRILFSSDSQRVMMIAPSDATAWNVADGRSIYSISRRTTDCTIFSADGRKLITVDPDEFAVMNLHDLDRRSVVHSLKYDPLNGGLGDSCGVISPDGKFALIGLAGPAPFTDAIAVSELMLWDLTSGEKVRSYPDFADSPIFSPDSQNIAYVAQDNTLRLWFIGGERQTASLGDARAPIFWSPSGDTLLAAGTEKDSVVVFSSDIGATELLRWSGAGRPVGYNADGSAIIVDDNGLEEWSLGSGAQMSGGRGRRSFTTFGLGGTQQILVSEPAQRFMTLDTGSDSGRVILSDTNDYNTLVLAALPEEAQSFVYSRPVLSSDGKVGLINAGSVLFVLDVVSNQVRQLTPKSDVIGQLAINADGSRALVEEAEGDHQATLLDLTTGKILHQLAGPSRRVIELHFSPDGASALAISGSPDSELAATDTFQGIVWDTATGQERYRFDLGAGDGLRNEVGISIEPASAMFSPNGTHIVTAVEGGDVRLWDAGNGAQLWSVPSNGAITTYSPDGKTIANGRLESGAVRLLDAKDGSLLHTFGEAVAPVTFSPDSSLLATGSSDNTLRLFEVGSGIELHRFDTYAQVRAVAFHPNGRSVFSGGELGVKQWRVDSLEQLIDWTKANRPAAELSCVLRAQYQVAPLCPPGTTATPDPNATIQPSTAPTPLRPTAAPQSTPVASPTADLKPVPLTPTKFERVQKRHLRRMPAEVRLPMRLVMPSMGVVIQPGALQAME